MEALRSGIEHLKQAEAHMSKANGIMSDCVSKLKSLEEENAALRAELDCWKAQSDASYMKLPLDADGVPIRLKDWVWYVGIDAEITKDDPQQVVGFVSDLGMNGIYAVTRDYPDKAISPKMLTHRAPEPPDSWEKLEEDASVGAQYYCANRLGIDIRKTLTSDDDSAFAKDIIRRAKKLAGIDEEAQR